MATTEASVPRRYVLAAAAVSLAGCASDGGTEGGAGEAPGDGPSSGWSVRFEYDGPWQGSVSVTTADGDSNQAFDGEGTATVDVEEQMGVETGAVLDVVVTAQKRADDDGTLRVAIRRDGDVVAEGTTDAPQGQVMVSHHTEGGDGEDTPTDTPADEDTPTDTETPSDTETPTEEPDLSGWSVRFEYDGPWQGTITVTTGQGDSHQAYDDEGPKTVDVEEALGVETGDVLSIVVQAEKRAGDDRTLRVAIRKDGEVVAEGSTDAPNGEVMVSHHE